ncbi:MAG: hypothetical protein DRJ14_08570 [Acidobacteria bacterium]|nr:MAG: hypothetical protein DRJ14_08570 [Acidobacteriota bacterium]
MVALLVLFTILACLLADAILLSVRERRAATAGQLARTPAHAMVFAQDGGEPVKKDEKGLDGVPWKEKIDSEDEK